MYVTTYQIKEFLSDMLFKKCKINLPYRKEKCQLYFSYLKEES
ncbi:hypothetical protein DF16_orf01652 [Bacillus thuringiensis serovar kurstaki str. YBT-1520]|uniref:Uncharacterized protein n=1 Tax=Bacillus cereus (strain B4264) TaxID=405532 RepID=B7HCQ0_BACC4|nr:hypothetical protein BCB4264_A4393 [Bacillus cereus B4264]AGE80159.1 hypothetical protein HD73_4581 [Bacillus thuringiensis serovar kurstaki str. HD73]AIM30067.1 hypothetical protein DF16_orf01652 [Bacillus thuringiensis serovar kurstaki str. YBT-1520]ASI85382.1 hypothetical protein FORC48_4302 [Bacillus cereus]EDZ51118.1 hypothetical protein BCAH1134_4370 [Bacillus cereus AH1134]EEK60456.1 hypothetical protein bcere0005_38980 [Bacillus cereus 172560W]EEK87721.1 hypothetical protein bcere0